MVTAAAAIDVTHGTHGAVRSTEAGSKARAVTGAACGSHRSRAASPNIRAASAMKRRAPTMYCCISSASRRALTMIGTEVLRVCGCLTGTVRIAHKSAKIQTVIVRNFPPPLPGLMQRGNIIEALASGVCQQMRLLQASPTKPS